MSDTTFVLTTMDSITFYEYTGNVNAASDEGIRNIYIFLLSTHLIRDYKVIRSPN